MTVLVWVERGVGWTAGLFTVAALVVIFIGVAQALRRPAGLSIGRLSGLIRSPWFHLFASLFFFGLGWLLWRPVFILASPALRILALNLGALLYFPGVGLVLWGRLVLGKQYFVSSGLGAQLFEGHQLVTSGPYALVRHPMYLGILMMAVGGILLYRTWTMLLLLLFCLALRVRARREEEALQVAFGQEWSDYTRRVPRFFPRLKRSQ